jgi:hypothetical protein
MKLGEAMYAAHDKALKSALPQDGDAVSPDRNPGDADAEAKFKEVNEAYETLKDRRSAQPMTGSAMRPSKMAAWRAWRRRQRRP